MKSMVALLSVLVGLAGLPGLAAAGVVAPKQRDIQAPDGWCCMPGCDICAAEVRCRGDVQCEDFFITHTCCMMERRLDVNGTEKIYTKVTGKEVQFINPK